MFLSKFETVLLKKGDYFIREGEVCKKVGFIVSGSMLCSYNKDGETVIDEFSLDKEFISFLTHSPAEKDLKCLEDIEIAAISYNNIQQLYALNSIFKK